MHFTDKDGRNWSLALNVGILRRVRNNLGVDLLDVAKGNTETWFEVKTDPELLCNILYSICEKQCEKYNLTDLDFSEIFDGEAIENAVIALQEAILSFSPASRRMYVRQMMLKTEKLEQDAMDLVLEQVESPGMRRMMGQKVQELIYGNQSSESPESSTSTPDHSHSEN